MRFFLLSLFVIGQLALATPPAMPAVNIEPEPEQWKGKPYDHRFQFSFLPGVGVIGASAGFSLNGAAAVKILNTGFLDDVNDQAYVEALAGPCFLNGLTTIQYSSHLRWDFHKNEFWSFYALGGIGGTLGGGLNTVHPRFGVGAFWNIFEFASFRAEISHEFMGLGIVYLL
jgi:hypothetical protein